MLAQALRQCGNDLCRENAIRQAISLGDYHPSILPPGIKINTGPENRPIRQMRLIQFDGSTWLPIGDLIKLRLPTLQGDGLRHHSALSDGLHGHDRLPADGHPLINNYFETGPRLQCGIDLAQLARLRSPMVQKWTNP